MTTSKGTLHLMALADADPTEDGDYCGHNGPGGSCTRERGHFDTDQWGGDVLIHWSYDTDHYQSWPVGWKSHGDRIKLITDDPNFGSTLTGNDDYRRGVQDAIQLARATLTNPKQTRW